MSDNPTLEAERAAFEAHFGPKDSIAWRNTDGTYKVYDLQRAWEIWQAARRAAPAVEGVALPPKQSIGNDERFLDLLAEYLDADTSIGPSYDPEEAKAELISYIDARTAGAAPADPMDWPIPCDVTVGAGTIKKGCKLRTLVARMEMLHRAATANWPKLTQEQKDANWQDLLAAAAPQMDKGREEGK